MGHIPTNMNATFIALVAKNSEPETFGDYRPITLCNLIYKISSKIIANRLKYFPSKHIEKEQYGFLKGRSIHDAVTIVQEVLHSMHGGKKEGIIMNIDLLKAYDRVDWSYIRMLLLKMGIPMGAIRWIMGCISSVRYAVLINGKRTPFFSAERGLR